MDKEDLTPIFVRESSTVSRDENGKILYYDGSFEDITARKQAEEALRDKRGTVQALHRGND